MRLGPRLALVAAAALVVGAALVVAAPSADAANKLDDATAEAFGGTYALDCRKPGVRVRVEADTLAVELGAKKVVSHDVQRALTFAGRTPPADYQGTLLGDVPGGEPLVLQVYRDAKGVSLLVDADVGLQKAFGKAALAGKFRSCDVRPKAKPAAPDQNGPAAPPAR